MIQENEGLKMQIQVKDATISNLSLEAESMQEELANSKIEAIEMMAKNKAMVKEGERRY